MAEVVCVQVIWNREHIPYRPMKYRIGDRLRNVKFFPVFVDPEPAHPVGRKGLCLASAWEQLASRTADGMLVLDRDVAIDPVALAEMFAAIEGDPVAVHVAPARIWPVSTHRADWVWAHWDQQAGQDMDVYPGCFSFCFTYLPRALIERAVKMGMKDWAYPKVDAGVAQTARDYGIKAHVVPGCQVVHVHY